MTSRCVRRRLRRICVLGFQTPGFARAIAAFVFVACAVCSRAQEPISSRSHVRIFAAGGLLGQFDGMPAYPGGSFDTDIGPGIHPYGGIEGLIDWWTRVRQPRDLLLLTANNMP